MVDHGDVEGMEHELNDVGSANEGQAPGFDGKNPLARGVRIWALVLVFVVLASFVAAPALTGSFVYDDRLMELKSTMDGWDDFWAVWGRNSLDYQVRVEGSSESFAGYMYRPIFFASLIGINVATEFSALAHHLLSFVLHLLAMCLVLVSGRFKKMERLVWPATIGFLFFALHPVFAEAVYWISGRSDVLAGLFLAIFMLQLRRQVESPPRSASEEGGATMPWLTSFSVALVVSCLGILSKNIFLPAALTVCVASLFPYTGDDIKDATLRKRLPRLAPWLAGLGVSVVVYVVLRSMSSASDEVGSVWDLINLQTLARVPHLVALAGESLLVPEARGMRMLGWELFRAWTAIEVVCLVALVVVVGVLIWRRHLRALVWLVGALVTLVPTVLVSNFFWLGFDRYLYVPLILLMAGTLDVCGRLELDLSTSTRRGLIGGLVVTLVAWVGIANFRTARSYHSHQAFLEAMQTWRPDDPTGYIMTARYFIEIKHGNEAKAALVATPNEHFSPPIAHTYAELAYGLGLQDEAADVITTYAARYPEDSILQLDALSLKLVKRDFEGSQPDLERLTRDPLVCAATYNLVKAWSAGKPGSIPQPTQELFARLLAERETRCQRVR